MIRHEKQEQMQAQKKLAVHEVNVPSPTPTKTSNPTSLEAALLQKLNENSETMKSMLGTMSAMQSQINDLKVKSQGAPQLTKKRWGCDYCVLHCKSSCSHCWACGAGDHRASDPKCPKKKGN